MFGTGAQGFELGRRGLQEAALGAEAFRSGILVFGALVLVAYLVGRWAPGQRRKLRHVVLPYGAWALLSFLAALFGKEGWFPWEAGETGAVFLAHLARSITVINLGGLVLFDLLMPLLRLPVESIVADLALGFAYLVAGLVALRQGGLNLSSIVATSAVVTAVLGLSLQATLGNVIGGVALQLDDSVHVGDWIQLENGRQGRVTEIRWRHTVVETRDWDTLIVPNASLLAQNILLLGRRQGLPAPHRMWVHFNVDFRYAPGEVIALVNAALQDCLMENLATDPSAHCICQNFTQDHRDSFASYAVRYWLTDLAKDDPTNSRVRQRIYSALKRAGIPLALPAAELFLAKDDAEHAQRKEARELERRVRALDAVELFDPMTQEEKARIAARVRPTPFTHGEIITRQGAVAHWLYILDRGTVEVRFRAESGEETAVATIEAPGFFGELGMMTGSRRSSSVVALGEVECLRLEKADFQQIIHGRPEIANGISHILAQRQVALHSRREDLDAAEHRRQVEQKHGEILEEIRSFFGLAEEES